MANIKINYLDKQQQQIKALNEEEQKHLVGGSSMGQCCTCGRCAGGKDLLEKGLTRRERMSWNWKSRKDLIRSLMGQ